MKMLIFTAVVLAAQIGLGMVCVPCSKTVIK